MGLAERLISTSIAELSSIRGSFASKFKQRRFVHLDATCRFDEQIFLEQFLCHLLFPISIFYLRYNYGKKAPYNQIFSNWGVRAVFWQVVTHLFWILILVYLIKRKELNESGITDEEFVSTIMAGIIFRGMVASKYGSLSKEEYKLYLGTEDEEEIVDLRMQLQLISGWMGIDPARMAYESELAFTRLGIYRDECTIPMFRISPQQAPKWIALLGQYSHVLKKGSDIEDDAKPSHQHPFKNQGVLVIEATDLMSVIFDISKSDQLKTVGQFIGIVASLLLGALPNIVRANCHNLASFTWATKSHQEELCISNNFFGNGLFTQIFSICLMFEGMAMAIPLNLFLITLILSSIRLYKCCEFYGHLIRSDKRSYDDYPVLDLKDPDNIRAWVRSFQALYQVGARYAQRMDWYSKFCFGLLVFLLLWVFLTFITTNAAYKYGDDDDDDSSGNVDDAYYSDDDDDGSVPNMMFVNVQFWIVLFLLIIWGFAFAVNLAIVAANNKAVLRQELELLQKRLCLREDLNRVRVMVTKYADENNQDGTVRSPLLNSHQESSFSASLENTKINDNNSVDGGSVRSVHASSVLQYRHQQSAESLEKVEANFEELDDLLDTAVKVIEGQMRVQPHRFLGANGTWGLVIQFFVVWVTVIGAVLGVAGIKTST